MAGGDDNHRRQYDLVLLGATGYTGKYCAAHVATHLPTDLKWAVAGRSGSKLAAVVDSIRSLNPDRPPPSVETCSLDAGELTRLARKTRLLVSCVGPYTLYGTPVVKACAENGTHYIDTTGETPWVRKMIREYHDVAKSTGAILIPQIGFESAASDMLTYVLVSHLRRAYSVGTREVVTTLHDYVGKPSGGTLATVLTFASAFSNRELVASFRPYALSPVPGPPSPATALSAKLLGVRSHPDLGLLTTGISAACNASIVQRSWGLLDRGAFYGPRFSYAEYASVRNRAVGVAVHLAMVLLVLVIACPPARWLLRRLVPQPGEGPSEESTRNDMAEYRAVATADDDDGDDGDATRPARKAYGALRWKGSLYDLTAVFMMQGAITLLRDETRATAEMGGGVLTPATLGDAYLARLRKAGVEIGASDGR